MTTRPEPAPVEPRDDVAADPEAPPEAVLLQGSVVVLRLGHAEFALPIAVVREVLRPPPLTRTPFAPSSVLGAVAVRGTILPVVDLGLRLARSPARRPGSLLVVQQAAGAELVGLLVDAVTGLIPAGGSHLRPTPAEAEASLPFGWITAMLEPEPSRLVALLDPARILDSRAAGAADEDATRTDPFQESP